MKALGVVANCSRRGFISTARRFGGTSASSGSPTSIPIARCSNRA
jgi:hypothetical protein